MTGPILITAGGTGGHLFPAEALSAELTRRGRRVLFVTDTRGKGFARADNAIETARISAATFESRNPLALVKAAFQILAGIVQAHALIGRKRPAAAIGFGGYPSLPAMIAAWLRGVPSAIHEQNSVLGRANRALAGRVDLIASSFPTLEKSGGARVALTGNPVRPGISAIAGAPYAPPEADGPIRVAVFGGSQGARIMSDIVPGAVAALPEALRRRIALVQQCRPEDLDRTRAAYASAGVTAELQAFFADVPDRLKAAHVVVARSGASTCAELTAVGRPSILVPYPFATDDHQTFNARALEAGGAAVCVPQPQFTPATLAALLGALLADPVRLSAMAAGAARLARPDAASALADLVERLAMGDNARFPEHAEARP